MPGHVVGGTPTIRDVPTRRLAYLKWLPDEPDWLHADRFAPRPPLLAVHLGRRQRGQALAGPILECPDRAVPRRRLADRRRRRNRRPAALGRLDPARPPPRLGGQPDGHPDHRAAGAGRPVHRRRFRPRSPGGFRRHALGHPLQRHEPAPAVAALVAALADASATASRASRATRRSARSPTTRACRASTPTASTEAPCVGGPARTGPSRPTRRSDG